MTSPKEQAEALLKDALRTIGGQLETEKTRKRAGLVAEGHVLQNMLKPQENYFSQSGQDRVVDFKIGQKEGGIFVDVGAYDGVSGSNSLFFELMRGWSGILVEPAPTQLRKAKARRKAPCYGVGIGPEEGSFEFMEVTSGYRQMSGFLESYNENILKEVRANPDHAEIIHQVETKTLAGVLREAGLNKIDFLSLDVEGGEVPILESFPFDDFDIEFWSIENNTQGGEIPEIMRANGYNLIEFVGVDDIFRKQR